MKCTRMTVQKMKIMEYLKSVHTHPSAEKVYKEVRKELPTITLATVYRNLNKLAEEGKVLKIKVGSKTKFDADTSSHQHCVCSKCGKIKPTYDFQNKGRKANGEISWSSECKACKGVGNKTYYYVCASDPTGFYPEGSKLTAGQVKNTLEMGYMIPGSVWLCSLDGYEYTVRGNEHWHTIIECVKKPDESYLKSVVERQRLCRC